MKNTFGNALALTIFGESHGPAIGAVLDGMAAGVPVDEAALAALMDRRRARGDGLSTARVEADEICILSEVAAGHTTGTPIALTIANQNTRSADYAAAAARLRPGHADYTAWARYRGFQDARGGGHFSGRITAGLVAGGGIVLGRGAQGQKNFIPPGLIDFINFSPGDRLVQLMDQTGQAQGV